MTSFVYICNVININYNIITDVTINLNIMNIPTKYDIHQQVFFLENNKVLTGKIANLQANVYTCNVISITYTVSVESGKPRTDMKECLLFDSKQSLLNSL